MNRIPPSQKIGKKLETLLTQGLDGEGNVTSALIRLGVERLVQELLEQEVTDYLEREHYQRRRPEQEHRGYRNGYERGRIRTAEGEIVVQVPQVREAPETYRSELMVFLRGNSDVLERLAVEMYARGLSTRDIEDALIEATGDRLLSRTAVSQVTEVLWADYEAFAERDLSGFEVEYLFLDAVYESLRQQAGLKEGVLVAWGICSDGRKALLHLALGNKESYGNWLEFLRDMVRRGLRAPVLTTTDGSPGLMRAVEEIFPNSLRQRCLAHKTRNVLDKVPDSARAEAKAMIQAAYYAPNQEVARMIAAQVLETYQSQYPSAMKSFQDDWEACIAYLRCPAVHHKRIRTTNLLERSFLEERRRTKVIPRFFSEKSCLKLVFATLWRASQNWQGVRMSEFECQQLKLLRRELGLLPDGTQDAVGLKMQRRAA
ncbi:MAG: IS256 family transposase [Candidatus Promineifilaceae bacterium]|jgi:transposase-like protein